jgi:alkylation response protein AidB-like acyl-CoA dehydrogenase
MTKGGGWLLEPTDADSVMTPERLTGEHRLISQTTEQFVVQEVVPQLEKLEQHDWTVARRLIHKCAELGLLGIDVPEEYGGVNLDKVTSLVVSDRMAGSASFGATFGGQTNLTVLPLSLFGTAAQKQKYLPKLLSGEIIGAYCLSETGSGSDALGAKTKAVKQADGSFVLNGEKMWITNGGFADIFIVFAKVDGEHFSAFIVERAFGGLTSGKEEHKMGLHGEPARRRRQGPQGGVQRAELRPLQARRHVQRRRSARDWRIGEVCRAAQAIRAADRQLWRHPTQAR